MFVVEMTGQRLLAVSPDGVLSLLGGNGAKGDSGDSGPPRQAQFNGMHSLVVAPSGEIYLADTWNNRVRKIDARGESITPFAGTGQKGFGGDGGPADKAQFGGIYCLAIDPAGERMYLDDLDNHRIRAITLATGIVETVAGNGARGEPKDDADAKQSPLVDPRAVAADHRGNVYILERKGDALRVVDKSGRIRTLIGGTAKGVRDETRGEPLPLKGPKHLCIDQDGNVLIADTENHLIRKYLPAERKLISIAGSGQPGSKGLGGPPLAAELKQPHGVYVHPSGEIYIADSSNNRIVKIKP
jgi:DNA-binding beta-propeller fold protein YncE